MGLTTDRNRARLPSLFGMKFTQVPGKNTATNLQQFSCLSLDNGTEKLRKAVLDNSGSHTSIGIHWHPFGVLEADYYHQNNRLQFGNKLIFVNYIYMNKREFK
jgi:hypothetical protein